MTFIPTKIHAVLDYLSVALFIASPWLFGFANGGAAQWIPIVAGLLVLGQSLLTDYEGGVAKVMPMPAHLMTDVFLGVVLVALPWLFGFAADVYLPHVLFGTLALGAGLFTKRVPDQAIQKPAV
jgi:hypothetical protein